MAEKKESTEKGAGTTRKVAVTKKTLRDLKLKPGKSDSLKGGFGGKIRF